MKLLLCVIPLTEGMKRTGEWVGIRHYKTYARGYICGVKYGGANYRVFSCLRASASISEGELGNTPEANAFFTIGVMHKSDLFLGLPSGE